MSKRSILIADCDSFYVSVQRVFDPSLRNRPVVVLSNNDGCAISRSLEAKAIGIKMGDPFFKFQHLIEERNLAVFSSNYALYADMSNRVMNILSEFSDRSEIYSIDEIFIDLTGLNHVNHTEYACGMQDKVLRCTGIPIGIGIGETKTLAKVANKAAKKNQAYHKVCNFNAMKEDEIDEVLSVFPIEDIWGVGGRIAPKLPEMGIHTALELKRSDPHQMRKQFSLLMEKTVRELNGIVCIEIEEVQPPRKQVVRSRSFGMPVMDLPTLEEAITMHTSRAAEKIRQQGLIAGCLQVFIRTSPFKLDEPQYSNGISIPMPDHTSHTNHLLNAALRGLKAIYKPGYRYAKAGVMLGDLISPSSAQKSLFQSPEISAKNEKLMGVIDSINKTMGRSTIKFASEGIGHSWKMKQSRKSPSFTTRWEDLIKVD